VCERDTGEIKLQLYKATSSRSAARRPIRSIRSPSRASPWAQATTRRTPLGFINLIGLPIKVRALAGSTNEALGGRFETGPSEVFERFSGSLDFDRRLIDADIRGSQPSRARSSGSVF